MDIYEQLQEYCGCCQKDSSEKNITELVHLVSTATCWAGEGSDTFLMGERREVFELPSCPDKCLVYEFKPFYHPFVAESVKFVIIKEQGINQEIIKLTEDDFIYDEFDKCFKIKLPYSCECNICKCGKKYRLVATYDAGYDRIPEFLLPVFCEMLDLVNKKNECSCECQTCEAENYDNKTDYGEYTTGDMLTADIINKVGPLLTKTYNDILSLISLCEPRYFIYGEVI